MRIAFLTIVLVAAAGLVGCDNSAPSLSLEEEYGFRQLRQDLHVARTTGDYALLHSLWADDAVLATGIGPLYGADAIADHLAADPHFGNALVLTSESSWRAAVNGEVAEFAFESITVDLGGADPRDTMLSIGGAQNPAVEIVAHTHSVGVAVRADDGRWVFKEVVGGVGPLVGGRLAGIVEEPIELTVGDEVGFRRMRETFHLATTTGDYGLLRSVWADDAVFTAGELVHVGGDAIADFMSSSPSFGHVLVLTPESSQRLAVNGDVAQYAFECITISVGGSDPLSTDLCTDGEQNPLVEIVRHTHTSGFAERVEEGRWVFKEFNGGEGPLPPEGLVD